MKLSQNISNSNLYLRFRNKRNSLPLKSIYTLAKSTCKYFYIMYIIQNCILCEFPWGPATTSWQIRHIVVVIVILHCDWFSAPQWLAISRRKFQWVKFLDNIRWKNDFVIGFADVYMDLYLQIILSEFHWRYLSAFSLSITCGLCICLAESHTIRVNVMSTANIIVFTQLMFAVDIIFMRNVWHLIDIYNKQSTSNAFRKCANNSTETSGNIIYKYKSYTSHKPFPQCILSET